MICYYTPCDNKVVSKGLCNGHYQQAWRGSELTPLKKKFTLADVMEMGGKKCTKCEEWKSPEDFYRRTDRDNIQSVCKPCCIENVMRARRES